MTQNFSSPDSEFAVQQNGSEQYPAPMDETGSVDVTGESPGTLDADTDEDAGEFEERMLGEFRLLRRLGRGGMADVFLAEQTSLKRRVAIKILRKDQLDRVGDDLLKRFQREAKAAGGLSHPNIVQVYSVGRHENVHYIVQEYVQGGTLRGYLSRKGPPDLPLALHIMKQVAAALDAAAQAGIVHRDIKPENIMLTRKGEVKVTDFGLALLTLPDEEPLELTQHGTTLGTPSYMSPEQVSHAKVDARSDIYSFGSTCYHLFAGKPPFHGPTAMSVAIQHVNDEPEPLSQLRPDLPPALYEIIEKMMRKDVEQRYQTAKELFDDIRRVAKYVKQNPEAAGRLKLSSVGSRSTRRKRTGLIGWAAARPAAALITSLVLVGSASAGAGWMLRPRNPFDKPPLQETHIPKLPTAREQYLLAMRLAGDEHAWRAVIDNFDSDAPEYRRAQEKLAFLYLHTGRFEAAKRLFDQLAFLGAEHADLRIQGLAGQAVVASLQGEYRKSQNLISGDLRRAIDQLPPPRQLDPRMESLLRETIAQNQQQLGGEIDPNIARLFRLPGPEDPPPLMPEDEAM